MIRNIIIFSTLIVLMNGCYQEKSHVNTEVTQEQKNQIILSYQKNMTVVTEEQKQQIIISYLKTRSQTSRESDKAIIKKYLKDMLEVAGEDARVDEVAQCQEIVITYLLDGLAK